MSWLRQCVGWRPACTSEFPPAINLRPEGRHLCQALVMADLSRVAAILQRIAAGVGELARPPRGRLGAALAP